MVRRSDHHKTFNGSTLWSISLVAVSLVVPWILAQYLPRRSESVLSSPPPSPQPSVQPSPTQPSAEQEWRKNLVSQSLSWKRNPTPTGTKTSSPATIANNQTSKSQSTTTKSPTSRSSNPTTQTQANQQRQTNKQQTQSSQSSTKTKAQATAHSTNAPILEMRVAVAKDVSSLVVATSTPAVVTDANGKVIGKLAANQGTEVAPDGSNIRLGKWRTPAGVWVKPENDGFVFVNNRWYRGDFVLVSQGDTLLAINYIELERYLASVVGSEVYPSWPMAALKAQAIAARSYAIVHYIRPAHALYDLGNTERWQVYKGIESEWNTTTQAVKETSGVFLSYKGGVVESMYAASDDIVTNVFGGRGMSQTGAYDLAKQGYDYKQILSTYYPGVGLAWMDTKQVDTD